MLFRCRSGLAERLQGHRRTVLPRRGSRTTHTPVRGQLRSGDRDYSIEFNPRLRSRIAYRVDPEAKKGRNVTTPGNDTTRAALWLLMRIDQALKFKNEAVLESVEFTLKSLMKVRYSSGAWPQRFDRPPTRCFSLLRKPPIRTLGRGLTGELIIAAITR